MWGFTCMCGRQRELRTSVDEQSALVVQSNNADAFGGDWVSPASKAQACSKACASCHKLPENDPAPGWCDLLSTCVGSRPVPSMRQRCHQLRLRACGHDLDEKVQSIVTESVDETYYSSDCCSRVQAKGSGCVASDEASDLRVALQATQEMLENANRQLAAVAGLSVEEAQAYLEKCAMRSTLISPQKVRLIQDPIDKENMQPAGPPSSNQQETNILPGSPMNSPDEDMAKLRVGHWEYPMSRDEKKFLALIAEHEVAACVCKELTQVRKEKQELAYQLASARATLSC